MEFPSQEMIAVFLIVMLALVRFNKIQEKREK